MAKRRGRGEGSISRRSDGRYMARVDMGRDDHGRRLRKTVYGATRAAVARSLNELLGRSTNGELLTTSTPTLATWLKDWHTTHADTWRPATRRLYRIAIEQWIVPSLGSVRLEQLKPAKIQKWINAETVDGARGKIVLAHVVLRSALKWAMQQRVVTFNAATLCKVPRPTPAKATVLSIEQARTILQHTVNHRLGGLILVSLTMGLRIGEACGLTWPDIDQTAKTLKVRQQVIDVDGLSLAPLKTAHSRRTLTMPVLVAEALKARKVAQLEERLKAGAQWAGVNDLAFTTERGAMLNPSVVRDALADVFAAADVPPVKFHALRHTAATLLLADGTPLFDVSRILGHSQVSTTADVYGHLVPDMTAAAAARMDQMLKSKA